MCVPVARGARSCIPFPPKPRSHCALAAPLSQSCVEKLLKDNKLEVRACVRACVALRER